MAQTSLGVACWASEHPNPQVYKYKYVFIYIYIHGKFFHKMTRFALQATYVYLLGPTDG